MKISIEVLENPDEDWDNRVLQNDGTVYQTTTYARIQEKTLGMKTRYLLAKHNSKIVGQLMITHGPRFAKYLRRRSKKLHKFFERFFKIYTFVRGPIIINKKLKKQIYSSIIDYLDETAKKEAFMALDMSLPIKEEKPIYKLFYKKGFYSDSWGTVLINTNKPEEVLWKEISRSHRRSVRKGIKQGLVVKEVKTKQQQRKAISIIHDMAHRNKIFADRAKDYGRFMEILRNDHRGKTLYIEKDGKGIATITLSIFGQKVTQSLIAHTDYSIKKRIYGVDFLEWHIIKWCNNNGYETYDLASIRPDSKDKKDLGLKHYKTNWGGETLKYPYFSKNYSKLKKAAINLLMKKKKKLVIQWK